VPWERRAPVTNGSSKRCDTAAYAAHA